MRNLPHKLMYLNPGSQLLAELFGELMESLVGGALLEEVCHWEVALKVCSLVLLSVLSSCLLSAIEMWHLSFMLLSLSCAFPAMGNFLSLWNAFFLMSLWSQCFYHSSRKVTNTNTEHVVGALSDKVLHVSLDAI